MQKSAMCSRHGIVIFLGIQTSIAIAAQEVSAREIN